MKCDFRQISSTLASLSTDWDVRCEGLKSLQSAFSDADSASPALFEGMHIVAKPLAVQVWPVFEWSLFFF